MIGDDETDDKKLCPFQMRIFKRYDGQIVILYRICRYDCIYCSGVFDEP